MNPALKQYFVKTLKDGIEAIGSRFEAFGQKMMDEISPVPMTHRGLNA